ncbi:cytochrome c biogenesis CcdA family protein [Paenibacillus sp. 481]|uniref:cytochrome c biogenesis CcdA family protein n=1 Tax=Paenibacillus sp. 481 TaxID=2835869 RepID=UPI001E45A256|nr:cytochrome c biogenesis protein CcdA [Paenibacillus sp. 481]UHA72854.1 cytochrome c biogenesis protein CcdA [Paenibacillus sp. 481]
MTDITVWIAFWAGVVSFISPCCLPLYPTYLSIITGMSVNQLKQDQGKREVRMKMLAHTFFFVLGISFVFFTLGLSATLLGSYLAQYRDVIRQISAVFIIVMGLFIIGIFRPDILMKERKLEVGRKGGFAGTFLLGVGFSAGWTPCIGPILGAIITLSASQPSMGMTLTSAYSLGFAIPFFILTFFIGSARWLLKYSNMMMKIGGVIMIIMGILLMTDKLTILNNWLLNMTPEWLINLT